MEQNERTESIFNINVDPEAKSLLKTTSLWAKITAIAAFIQVGVSIVSAFLGKESYEAVGQVFSAIIVGLISVLVNVFLFRFAKNTANAVDSSNQHLFAEGINDLRNYFKVLGIVIIVLMGLAIMAIFFFIVAATV